jgi:hypothetical protein
MKTNSLIGAGGQVGQPGVGDGLGVATGRGVAVGVATGRGVGVAVGRGRGVAVGWGVHCAATGHDTTSSASAHRLTRRSLRRRR